MINVRDILFTLGGMAVGALTAGIIENRKYKKRIREEVDSVWAAKKEFDIRNEKNPREENSEKQTETNQEPDSLITDRPPLSSWYPWGESAPELSEEKKKDIIDYTAFSGTYKGTPIEELDDELIKREITKAPRSISGYEFGSYEDYEIRELVYFPNDGNVVDDEYRIVEDVEELIGADFAIHIGDYEDNVGYFINDARSKYYLVKVELGTLEEYKQRRPY